MSRIRVGDTVAFRRDVANKCNSAAVAEFRGIVTGIAGAWLFIEAPAGRTKVMPATSMARVAPNGVVLELVWRTQEAMQHAVMARRIALFDLAVDPPALCNEQRARLAESERGLDIEPLAPEQDAPARLAAQKLFGQIEWNAREVCWLCAENGWPTRVANASI